ncbi:EAL domain-containing protein [Acidovorax sp. MR-S7]|uniref:bifunctional diguanylate cyclase/phosphodiesterase n=1 Tax=Acidovorax sp. MR-S7 TaxID=1268622 RepID=UPI000377CAD6|nr:EAL domain-containing protein [Acidovorax sp. MR-S7]GAD22816.1 diguanylate cyclase/phosphodiesterase [Acidovorax sp. MR-S7]
MRLAPLPRPRLAVWSAVGLFLLALGATVGLLLKSTHGDALGESEARVTRFVTGAQAGMNRTLLAFDVLLATTEELLELATSNRDHFDRARASELLRTAARQNLMLRYVALLDGQGRLLASSIPRGDPQAVELPPGFLAAAMAPTVPTLAMSAPQLSTASSERVLYVARPLRLGDGTQLLALAQVPVDALVPVLMQGLSMSDLEVTLERGRGEMLIGVAAQQSLVERTQAAGPPLGDAGGIAADSWGGSARLSGAPAMVSARPLLYPDLWITASLPRGAALAAWEEEARSMALVALLFGASVVLAGIFATLYLQRMHGARQVAARSKATLDQALSSMVSGFVLLDADHCLVQWNQRFEEMFPWLQGMLAVGLPFRRVLETTVHYNLPGMSAEDKRAWIEQRLQQQRSAQGTFEQRLPSGRYLQLTERATPEGGLVIVYHDVTDLRRAAAEIENLAFYDPLTGLPNRRLLLDRLGQACTAEMREGTLGAVLFIDLDHFKTLNDSMGHEVGDQLLQQVARRLEGCVRGSDMVARLGGDEFVVMLLGLPGDSDTAAEQVRRVGEKIVHLLAQPFHLGRQTHHGSCSMGATLFGEVLQTAAEVLKQADIAMYQVKAQRGNALCFFDPGMQVALNERARLASDLQAALPAGQFLLYLQPQCTRDGAIVGAEALLRWRHPVRGLVPPAQFIGVAEDSDLIVAIGHWVLRSACAILARWAQEPGLGGLSLSVNVSARQFRQADFVELVTQALQASGARAHRLELELTESLVLEDVQDSIAKMHQLRTKGVRFAVDDFGTGYSSLAYLTRLPLHRLKIDRSFVHHLGERHSDNVVVQTILGMARNLELEVVAEGVETEAQRDFLSDHGCDVYQGYLFGRPMPVDALEALLAPLGQ